MHQLNISLYIQPFRTFHFMRKNEEYKKQLY